MNFSPAENWTLNLKTDRLLGRPFSLGDRMETHNKKRIQRGQCQEVEKRLLEVATRVFADKGYSGASVQEIVRRAGVTKPVLYYYFGSKAGIFRAILDEAAYMLELLLEEVGNEPGSAVDRFLFLYTRTYQNAAESPDVIRLIHNLLFAPPEGVPPYDYASFPSRMLEAIKEIYAEGVARGEFVEEDPGEVAMLVLSIMDFCFHHDRSSYLLPQACHPEKLLKLAVRGLAVEDGKQT